MADIRNCRRCGKMFAYIDKPICPKCVAKENEDFETVRVYVKDNPGCNITEAAEGTGIDKKLITKFVREKRIEFAGDAGVFITCEKCNAPIHSGRFCNNCLSKLGKDMAAAGGSTPAPSPVPTQRKSSGMHISKFK